MKKICLETDRLILRLPEKGDYAAFVAGYAGCAPAQNRFDEGKYDTAFMTREWFSVLVSQRKQEAVADLCYLLSIFRREDGAALGGCDVTPLARDNFQSARLGYAIHNQFWGRGYAAEAVRALIAFSFGTLRLHRLEANVDPENLASRRVAEKAGLQFECVRKAFFFDGTAWRDQNIYYVNNDALPEPDENFY
jgi:ribosomal-protein-alanine N-acetyltransferase